MVKFLFIGVIVILFWRFYMTIRFFSCHFSGPYLYIRIHVWWGPSLFSYVVVNGDPSWSIDPSPTYKMTYYIYMIIHNVFIHWQKFQGLLVSYSYCTLHYYFYYLHLIIWFPLTFIFIPKHYLLFLFVILKISLSYIKLWLYNFKWPQGVFYIVIDDIIYDDMIWMNSGKSLV